MLFKSFQYSYSNHPSHLNLSNVSIHPKSPELPSINEFLFNLDQKYKCDNVYSQFENAFSEEEITVNAIKDLSDEHRIAYLNSSKILRLVLPNFY